MGEGIQEWIKSNLWKTAFKTFKFFKDCLPHILLGPFLNTLTQMGINYEWNGETIYEIGMPVKITILRSPKEMTLMEPISIITMMRFLIMLDAVESYSLIMFQLLKRDNMP